MKNNLKRLLSALITVAMVFCLFTVASPVVYASSGIIGTVSPVYLDIIMGPTFPVFEYLKIAIQPKDAMIVCTGQAPQFSVLVDFEHISRVKGYQWQCKEAGGSWVNLPNGVNYPYSSIKFNFTGATTATLKLQNPGHHPHGVYEFRCLIKTTTGEVSTRVAKLDVQMLH